MCGGGGGVAENEKEPFNRIEKTMIGDSHGIIRAGQGDRRPTWWQGMWGASGNGVRGSWGTG